MRVYVRCRPWTSFEQALAQRDNNDVTMTTLPGDNDNTTTTSVATTVATSVATSSSERVRIEQSPTTAPGPQSTNIDTGSDIIADDARSNNPATGPASGNDDHHHAVAEKVMEESDLSTEKVINNSSLSAVEVDPLVDIDDHHTRLKIRTLRYGTRRLEFDGVFTEKASQEQVFQVYAAETHPDIPHSLIRPRTYHTSTLSDIHSNTYPL